MTRRFVMEFERPLVELEDKIAELRTLDLTDKPDLATEIAILAQEIDQLRHETYEHLTPWARVQIARHPDRPKTTEFIEALFTDVIELHGDRLYGDDEAIFAGFGTLSGRRVVILGHRKGKTTKENVRRNFGSPHPEGFRKAMRVMRLADRFGLPIVSFLDTAGAFPGIEAEERGQSLAIAESLAALSQVAVPVVVAGIGEGGSGGALAIGFGDRLIMLENAYYSVISPEACASILYKDSSHAETAAGCLKMTAEDLVGLGIVDEVVPEPFGGAHNEPEAAFVAIGERISAALDELDGQERATLVQRRYERLRAIGVYA
ncbi:MAG: acetyl-CoA carboxylase carboxyltransferase subunit alpha [Coriobacteriia bacterium]|nr:acetyl-CoA carboxylase carboxyltransferase subunit alpha [Coriobacteriia bacterium]MDO9108238.1 acetyl-CoA carboxylase carboxyltransferase subunit alpha [Coriobacteriia bacterium]